MYYAYITLQKQSPFSILACARLVALGVVETECC